MKDTTKQPASPMRPRPVQPSRTMLPSQTELDRQRAADEGMTEPPPGTPAAVHDPKKTPKR